ncbi:hypothetical protein [Pontibacter pudoricolor]|uniref:hypothetical protein n=1 Tax=Pontibacter pudoricolor TaxID=2694930 RepID=UPI0013911F72|nr:hypothetical protein [Pontibacter pudoricolor]
MTYKTTLFSLITGFLLLAATQSFAQDAPTIEEQKKEQELAKEKKIRDEIRLQNVKDLKADTKANAKITGANAKEAKRADKEAAYAAKQAKRAAAMEAKAQRNRADADKQAIKSAKAIKKAGND